MNANKKKLKPTGATPPVLKKFLLCLLFIFAIGGYAGTAYLFSSSGKTIHAVLKKTLQSADPEQTGPKDPSLLDSLLPNRPKGPVNNALQNVRDLFGAAGGNATIAQFTFQGMLEGTDGAIAMINGKQVAVGTELEGVNVMAISNRVLILEYKGQTRKLGVGETVSVQFD